MEIWVRSQDKESLMKVNRVDKYGLSIVTFDNECREIYLGRYATEERALEVLDEIQDILNPKMIMETIDTSVKIDDDLVYRPLVYKPQQNMEIQQVSTYVYEMPIE